ncbi:MAG: septum formation protein Maf [Ichthyobacteriaceae bacterium]|nr:septum formation protein Maf [Ichthyobacteriaceae bacterium]
MPFKNIQNKSITLASASPRRQQFLSELGLNFNIEIRAINETYPDNLKREEIALHISEQKSIAFNNNFFNADENQIVITSDTIVWLENEALGKPKNEEEAFVMLKKLSGKSHEVITAFTVKSETNSISDFAITEVTFKQLTDDEINYYITNFKPFDKAGSYGIQEWIGLIGITNINGSYANVVGLPTANLYKILSDIK